MKKLFLVILLPLLMGAGCNMIKPQPINNTDTNADQEQPIGEQQNDYGCLSSSGYSYDELVGACIKPDLNEEKKQAAKLAVEYLTADGDIYGLTVVEVMPARCPGCWHVTLTDGQDRQYEVSINKNKIVETLFDYVGELIDVSGGQASGTAKAYFDGQTYYLVADFNELPEPEPGFFYEGWVVRAEPFNFISTGVASLDENVFEADQDLTDHDLYVLTIEPDDGDPAPAAHILEGTMRK